MKTFNVLSREDKVDWVVRVGIHLHTIQHSIFRADLYSVGNLFIEVLLFEPTYDFVHVRALNDEQLRKHINVIDLPADLVLGDV